jgi:hypothetical protein
MQGTPAITARTPPGRSPENPRCSSATCRLLPTLGSRSAGASTGYWSFQDLRLLKDEFEPATPDVSE